MSDSGGDGGSDREPLLAPSADNRLFVEPLPLVAVASDAHGGGRAASPLLAKSSTAINWLIATVYLGAGIAGGGVVTVSIVARFLALVHAKNLAACRLVTSSIHIFGSQF